MLKASNVRTWYRIHKWTSLICTAFLFVACLTGLPLVFEDEIGGWLNPQHYANLPASTPPASLDRLVADARRFYPKHIVTSVFVDDDEPQVFVSLAPSWAELKANPKSSRFVRFDARNGEMLEQSKPPAEQHQTFLGVMLRLHRDLFAGSPGEWFMGIMALFFVISLASGALVYGPFMRRLRFGTYRRNAAVRTRWFDLHNLLGIVTLIWTLVVGATGVMNELEAPLFALWQRTDVQAMLTPWQGKPALDQSELSSVQTAFDTTRHALPGMVVTSLTFPGGELGSPYHYLMFAKGNTPLTSQLFSPVLIDAHTGRLTAIVRMPWYLRALEVSRPLHFGDYGGLPLKIIWALFDVVLIFVLVSGVYLWLSRRKVSIEKELDRLVKLEDQYTGVSA